MDNKAYADFPCSESARKFKEYISKRGYFSYMQIYKKKITSHTIYRIIYWKEDTHESEN